MAGNSADPGRSVTSKIVAILLTFRDGNEHSLTEIARLTCLPVSTAHRLVTELAVRGVLERTDESMFQIGMSVKAIGSRRSYTPTIVESARRVLEDLVAAARTGARLGILTAQTSPTSRSAAITARSPHSRRRRGCPLMPLPSARRSWRSPQSRYSTALSSMA
jgi:DNA-binding IclR family transcriptional regulator